LPFKVPSSSATASKQAREPREGDKPKWPGAKQSLYLNASYSGFKAFGARIKIGPLADCKAVSLSYSEKAALSDPATGLELNVSNVKNPYISIYLE
jgi:hypothetical protein